MHCYFQHFVQHFKNEYLASLRKRHMYRSKKQGFKEEVIKVRDVVLIHEDNGPQSLWKLAIVKRVLCGSHGQLRAADFQTSSGVTKCSVHLLYSLEVMLKDHKEHFTGTEQQIPQDETIRISEQKNSCMPTTPVCGI